MDDPANCCLTVMDVIRVGLRISNSSLARGGCWVVSARPSGTSPVKGAAAARGGAMPLGLDSQFGSILMLMTITIRGATA